MWYFAHSHAKKKIIIIIMSFAFELFFFSYFSLILTFFCKNWLNYAMVRISLGVYSISFSSLTCLKVRNSSFYQAGNYSNPLVFERKKERQTDRQTDRQTERKKDWLIVCIEVLTEEAQEQLSLMPCAERFLGNS